jgi:transposase
MGKGARTPCAKCRRLQGQLDAQQAQLAALRAEVAQLREQLATAQKNSSTSSKPPSSDLVKPGRPGSDAGSGGAAIGGQPGHPKHQREPFPPEQITRFEEHVLLSCPCCGGDLRRNGDVAHVIQQVDITRPPLLIEQHTSYEYWCGRCQKAFDAPLPLYIVKGGLVGPQLTALIAYLKGVCHASFATVRKFLRDVVQLTISRGQLAKIISKVSQALEGTYDELYENLASQVHLNVDETGHKDNGEPWWTWCFRAELYTLFKIDPTRRADVLMEVLGREFAGVLGCDYFSAYRRYMRECGVTIQFCLAHLIRDVKFLTTLPNPQDRAYGQRLREALRQLFAVIHRRDELPERLFRQQLQQARDQVLHVATTAVPATRRSEAMAQRFQRHGAAYFQFITTPGVEPTNNLAEQAIRFVVIDRRITQGTRSEAGRQWCARIWTVIATCAQQGRSVFAYLRDAVAASFHGQEAPSLLPQEN